MGIKVTGLDLGHHAVRSVTLDVSFRSVQVLDVRVEPILQEDAKRLERRTPVAAPDAVEEDAEATEREADSSQLMESGELDSFATTEEDEAQPRTPGEELSPALLAAIARLREQGALDVDRVHCTLPMDRTYLTRSSFPFSGRREIEAVLRPQLDGQLPIEVDDLLIDFTRGGRNTSGEQLVFSIAMLPQSIGNSLEGLQSVGVDPRVVELSPFHHLTAWKRRQVTEPGACTALIDIGATSTSVLVMREDRVEYARTFRGGGDGVTQALEDAFSLDSALAREGKHQEGTLIAPEETDEGAQTDAALIVEACRQGLQPVLRQVRRSLQAHASEAATPVDSVLLAGGGATLGGIEDYFTEQLGVPSTRLALAEELSAAHPLLATRGHEFAGALGLALRALNDEGGSELNLRRDAFAFRGGYEFLMHRIPALAAGALAILFAGALIIAGSFAQARAERNHLDDALEQATAEVFGSPLLVPDRIRSRLSEGGGRSFMPDRSAMDIFFDISALVGQLQSEGVPVEARNIEVDLSRRLFDVRGIADSADAVDRLETRLARVSCLHTIQRGTLQASRQGDGFDFGIQGAASCTRANGEGERR